MDNFTIEKLLGLLGENKPAELVIGERESIHGNVDSNVMLQNLKRKYGHPYGIDLEEVNESIKTYQETLKGD